jgi:hypothetical protein
LCKKSPLEIQWQIIPFVSWSLNHLLLFLYPCRPNWDLCYVTKLNWITFLEACAKQLRRDLTFLSLALSRTSWLPMEGFSWTFTSASEICTKICGQNPSLVEHGQQ